MTDDDQKDDTKIGNELLKEFKRGQQDREEAIAELQVRRRLPDEPTQTFAYKLLDLVKLAYPTFSDDARKTLAKDYFVKGVHPSMQVALKSISTFKDLTINDLATECVRLQLAGVETYSKDKNIASSNERVNAINGSIDTTSLVDSITESVINKLQQTNMYDIACGGEVEESNCGSSGNMAGNVNMVQRGRHATRGNRFQRRGSSYPSRRGGRGGRGKNVKCRGCQSLGHIVKDCPTRFCQACGQRGHDAWQEVCPNYQ